MRPRNSGPHAATPNPARRCCVARIGEDDNRLRNEMSAVVRRPGTRRVRPSLAGGRSRCAVSGRCGRPPPHPNRRVRSSSSTAAIATPSPAASPPAASPPAAHRNGREVAERGVEVKEGESAGDCGVRLTLSWESNNDLTTHASERSGERGDDERSDDANKRANDRTTQQRKQRTGAN
jgi:hypothetical protein